MPTRKLFVPAALLALSTAAVGAHAQTLPANYAATVLNSNLSAPTAFAVAPDRKIYICQQGGALRVWNAGALTTITSFTVDPMGERGLLGVALDPSFATNRFVYVHYTQTTTPRRAIIQRITLDAAGTGLVAGSALTLLQLSDLSGATNHNGGAMHFGPDGRLYISVGENANGPNAQSIANLHGKILRINTSGAIIPTDNPTSFPGIMGTTSGDQRAIWAVGLRNPFTFNFQPGTGRMFINDVGQDTWEEINDGLVGRNYGWPGTEGRFDPAAFPNFTNPLVSYRHSTAAGSNFPPGIGSFSGFAISGGVFYNPPSPNFPMSYSGDYFFGEYVSDLIRSFDPDAQTGLAFASAVRGVVDLAVDSDGTLLYLARDTAAPMASLVRVTYVGVSGVCCNTVNGMCATSNGLGCIGSFIWGTTTCTPNPCTQPTGACCAPDGTCAPNITSANCTGAYQGNGTTCTPNPCPPPTGACCATDGTCAVTTSGACTGAYQGNMTTCTPNPCPQPTGACCAADGTCAETTSAACTGAYQGNATTCTPNPCPQPTGACCDGATCSVVAPAACTGPGTRFVSGAACNVAGNNTTPCCKADFNQNGTISVQDLFDFLASYFFNDLSADANASGGLSVQDLFDYLAFYFFGCA